MNRHAFVKRVLVGGGFIFLCAAPRPALGQSSPPGATLRRPVKSDSSQLRYISPSEFLAGLTLTDEQKTKINRIRDDTTSHLAAVAKDQELGPEVKDAMIGGYERIENSQIFGVLTTDQQKQVRRRLATLRATAQQPQGPLQQSPVPARNPQSK